MFAGLHAIVGGSKGYVFPSIRSTARPMSENTINGALRRLGFTGDEMTAHGFRAMASTLLNKLAANAGRLDQDARDVKTKFSKTFSTWFFPVGGEALEIVTEWIAHLRAPLLRGDSDALFPCTKREIGADGGFISTGLERFGWSTSEPVRRIFRAAFERAGLPYFPPHSFRHMLARFGEVTCQTPEQFKAWSQNVGHDDVMTTFKSYGAVPAHRQAELIRGLGVAKPATTIDPAYVAQVMAAMGQVERGTA